MLSLIQQSLAHSKPVGGEGLLYLSGLCTKLNVMEPKVIPVMQHDGCHRLFTFLSLSLLLRFHSMPLVDRVWLFEAQYSQFKSQKFSF